MGSVSGFKAHFVFLRSFAKPSQHWRDAEFGWGCIVTLLFLTYFVTITAANKRLSSQSMAAFLFNPWFSRFI